MPLSKGFKLFGSQKQYPTVSTGTYEAEIIDITDIGEKETRWGVKPMLSFKFKVTDREGEKELVKWVSAKWSAGGQYKPSTLFVIAESALGENLTSEPVELESLIGKKLLLTTKLVVKEDGNKTNAITDFAPIEKEE